jgi:hypothetical protein
LSGPLALAYVAPGVLNLHLTEVDESLDLTHTFPDSGHSLSFKLSLSQGSPRHGRVRRPDLCVRRTVQTRGQQF